jgi:hypothetical protein
MRSAGVAGSVSTRIELAENIREGVSDRTIRAINKANDKNR